MRDPDQQVRPEVAAVRASPISCYCCKERILIEEEGGFFTVSLTYKDGMVVGYGNTVGAAWAEAHYSKQVRDLEDYPPKRSQ